MKDLIEWHKERADWLTKESDKLLKAASDKRSSKHTRRDKIGKAGLYRGQASRHYETVRVLTELQGARHE